MPHAPTSLVVATDWLAAHLRRVGVWLDVQPLPESPHFPMPSAAEHPFPVRPRIMVADDEATCRDAAVAILSRWGVHPVIARDGAEAVAVACGRDFDLILMDLQMPVMDGLTATRAIRNFEREHARCRTPVIAYTSSPLTTTLMQAAGIDAVLDKPCDAQELQTCLLRWCPPW